MAAARPRRAAIYARVSTLDQTTENQLRELRHFIKARDWRVREYVDEGVSGSMDKRPALDKLLRDAKRRRFDVLVCWRLDRLGRNLRHLILFLEELNALGVAFVSLAEGIDATTPAGRLQMHILGAIAEFERARIAERVRLGLARVQANGQKLGRPTLELTEDQLATVKGLSVRQAAQKLGVSASTLYPEAVSKSHMIQDATVSGCRTLPSSVSSSRTVSSRPWKPPRP